MSTVDLVTTSYYTAAHLPSTRGVLLDVYREVYAEEIASNPFFSQERFAERLESHGAAGGWGCVVAEVHGHSQPAGFTYGFTARDGVTFKLCENMLRPSWRKRGISRLMHDELLRHRTETRSELLVRNESPRLRTMYESWGYEKTGQHHPFPDAPLYDVMVRGI